MLGGVLPEQLANAAPLPPLAAHLWTWFIDLAQTRGSSGFGPSRLSRLEIRAWEQDEGVALEAWERRAIMAVDEAYLTSVAEQQKKEA